MPIYKTKNEDFFKKWSPEMAYVLGFFAADGNMIKNKRGAHFIEFTNTEKNILTKIKRIIKTDLKISERKKKMPGKTVYRIQVGSKEIYNDLIKLGMTPNKSRTIVLPKIPKKYFSHFLRGYFDGDGCVNVCSYYKTGRNMLSTVINCNFVSGSDKLLKAIKNSLTDFGIVKGGSLCFCNRGYRLAFSINDSFALYNFMYKNSSDLFMPRKKLIFEKYFNKE
ncbi:MAG: LAGLIDADG family homing endonuclease [bacterium]|nr:LAGLIDADG family homing endonuclease [bacterium]